MNNNIDKMEFTNIQIPCFENSEYENTGTKYIPYGDDNDFPQQINFYSNKSTTHKACLKLLSMSISGKGFNNLSDSANKFIQGNDYEISNSTILEKIGLSLAIFNGVALEVIYSKDGKISSFNILPFQNVRAGHTDRYGNVSKYYYSTDFNKSEGEEILSFGFIPKDDKGNPIKNFKRTKEILYISVPNSTSMVYPLPNYDAALNWIAVEYHLGIHHLSSTVNSFVGTTMLTFLGGDPSEEDRSKNKKLFEKNYTGVNNTGKILINYALDESKKPIIDSLSPSNIVDIYANTTVEAKQNIVTSHGITSPSLIAISDGNSSIFSNGEELNTSWNVFYATTIEYYHQLIEKNMNIILKYAGFPNEQYKIVPFTPIKKEETVDIQPQTDTESATNDNLE